MTPGRADDRARAERRRAPTSSSPGSPSPPKSCARVEPRRSPRRPTASARDCSSKWRGSRRRSPIPARRGRARWRSSPSAATTRCRTPVTCSASHCNSSTRSACASAAPASDRVVLSDAALLHDVGYHINYEGHHKHSLHLIQPRRPAGHVADRAARRRARRALPSRVGTRSSQAPRTSASSTRKRGGASDALPAILRVADGFDRGHVGAVERLKVCWGERALRITPQPEPSRQVAAPRAVGRIPQVGLVVGSGGRSRRDHRPGREGRRERRVHDRELRVPTPGPGPSRGRFSAPGPTSHQEAPCGWRSRARRRARAVRSRRRPRVPRPAGCRTGTFRAGP